MQTPNMQIMPTQPDRGTYLLRGALLRNLPFSVNFFPFSATFCAYHEFSDYQNVLSLIERPIFHLHLPKINCKHSI